MIVVRLNLATMPRGCTWGHIAGLGILGGIGFTMSVFIALLSFTDITIQEQSKFLILISSAIAGSSGFIVLFVIGKLNQFKR